MGRLCGNERADAPVLAVLLLVAIVVIVGAGFSLNAFNIGQTVQNPAPSIAFEYDWDGGTDTYTITHASGDTVNGQDTASIVVRVIDDDTSVIDEYEWFPEHESPLQSGSSLVIGDEGNGEFPVSFDLDPGDTVEVVWTSNDDKTFILVSRTVSTAD